MEEIKNRLKLLELDLQKLDARLKRGQTVGTKKEWEQILHQSRKVEELAITQLAILSHKL
ncbi:MAG: hypothetical protein MRK01_07495 [Candidatus Scalindua sp.]|nr:hypothetical protein [Candidatus Scalindua sp.]